MTDLNPDPDDPQPLAPEGLPPDPRASFDPWKTRLSGTDKNFYEQLGLTGDTLDPPPRPSGIWPVSMAADLPAGTEMPAGPEQGGGYVLLNEVGRGGFGEVWAALQVSLGRIVAIKRLRGDLHEEATQRPDRSNHLTQSFRQEAMVTAVLDHPNIVPIYDLGSDPEGRPLLAMKLVKGKAWNDLLAEDCEVLSVSEFLAVHLPILVDVTHAVEFAHSRGVIHRDLKPSQVMVGEYGEVILMDWGLAIVFDTDRLRPSREIKKPTFAPSVDTASNPAGTVAFMAPEQTESTAERVGPHTDVYLLGGTLYYILSGKTPHWGENALQVFYQASKGIVAPPRETNPGREMPQELVDLAMDAMKPGVGERIQSVSQFAKRLNDYISGNSRRNLAGVITASVKKQLDSSPTEYRAFTTMLAELERARNLWPENADAHSLRELAVERYARLALSHGDYRLARAEAERLESAALQERLLGEINQGEADRLRTQRQRRAAIAAAFVLMVVIIAGGGAFTYSLNKARREAVAQRDKATLAREDSEKLVDFMVGGLRTKLSPIDPGLKSLDEVATKALEHYQRQVRQPLTDMELFKVHEGLLEVIKMFDAQGNTAQQKNAIQVAFDLSSSRHAELPLDRDWQLKLAVDHQWIGYTARQGGESDLALAEYKKARELLEQILVRRPEDNITRGEITAADLQIGFILSQRGDFEEAWKYVSVAVKERQVLVNKEPGNARFARNLAHALRQESDLLVKIGRGDEALERIQRAVRTMEDLGRNQPENRQTQDEMGHQYLEFGQVVRDRGDLKGAIVLFEKAVKVFEELVAADASDLDALHNLGGAYGWVGTAYGRLAEHTKALEYYIKFNAIAKQLYERDPSNQSWVRDAAVSHSMIARCYLSLEKPAEALAPFERSLELRKILSARDPANADWMADYANGEGFVAEVLVALDRIEEAYPHLEQMHTVFSELYKRTPTRIATIDNLSTSHFKFVEYYTKAGDREKMLEHYNEGLRLNEEVIRLDPTNYLSVSGSFTYPETLVIHLRDLGDAEGAMQTALENIERIQAEKSKDTILGRAARAEEGGAYVYAAVASQAMGDITKAFEWLEMGVRAGFPNPQSLLDDKDFKVLREADLARFESILKIDPDPANADNQGDDSSALDPK